MEGVSQCKRGKKKTTHIIFSPVRSNLIENTVRRFSCYLLLGQVQRLQDMQMEALMVEHREEGVGLCPVLVEYRASGRGERAREGKCSDGQLAAVQRQVQVFIEF